MHACSILPLLQEGSVNVQNIKQKARLKLTNYIFKVGKQTWMFHKLLKYIGIINTPIARPSIPGLL